MPQHQPKPPLPTLLVVDDQPLNVQILVHIFSPDHVVRTATSGEEALAACAAELPDLVLLDVMMPGMDGHEVCRRLKADPRTRDIPVIFVTVQNDPQEEATGLLMGAVDFIPQPVNAAVVRARVQTHLRLRQALHQVWELAFHDALTGLPNRRLLNDRLGQAMAVSQRSMCFGALIFLDLDNFKPLNDVHGHEVGDLLLVEAAQRLKACVREVDTVARFGGDEFVVLLTALVADRAEAVDRAGLVAEKIRNALAEPYRLSVSQGEGVAPLALEHRCTASLGVALFLGNAASTTDVIKWADLAMYDAKEAGRDMVHFYDPAP
ncbi:diguanylate cyclase [Rhodoferax sp. AJA081-3]|uniref:diguanylate cyclase domain-containing protein n=1 Tax=Rhodoferax sp. AJA081-3 TaxID=2752316 RepID=UPI001ADECE05|nr:diguanylate cyclase [Rhodoferax sp. AJA081-3]QTN28684.1 diguanylate cyclase [Rhodoferax sp. AJA081-3]